ncbi:MAG: hypothetical protein ACD_48C00667G0002 [uncultured bacterium]|nr:MAG: hypothetical protein ACD_48C00667G0002 [uncultured bacterium]
MDRQYANILTYTARAMSLRVLFIVNYPEA